MPEIKVLPFNPNWLSKGPYKLSDFHNDVNYVVREIMQLFLNRTSWDVIIGCKSVYVTKHLEK